MNRFCYTCGHKLHVHKRVWSYDGETGEPRITYDYTCHRKPFWAMKSHPVTEGE